LLSACRAAGSFTFQRFVRSFRRRRCFVARRNGVLFGSVSGSEVKWNGTNERISSGNALSFWAADAERPRARKHAPPPPPPLQQQQQHATFERFPRDRRGERKFTGRSDRQMGVTMQRELMRKLPNAAIGRANEPISGGVPLTSRNVCLLESSQKDCAGVPCYIIALFSC
jgi:hypothetical protein